MEKRFRKKPVVISAVKASDALLCCMADWNKLPRWLRDAFEEGTVIFLGGIVQIKTLEGWMNAGFDDWLIRGIKGEIYPCKPDIFAATYEAV